MGGKKFGDDGDAFVDTAAQLASLRGAGGLDLFQPDRGVLMIRIYCFANELVTVDHPYFADVARVVPDDDGLTHIPSESRGDIVQTLKMDTVAAYHPRFRHGEEETIEQVE